MKSVIMFLVGTEVITVMVETDMKLVDFYYI